MSEIHEKKRENQNSPDYNQSSDSQANYEDPPEDAEVQTEESAPAAQQHFAANPVVAKAPENDALQAPAHPVSKNIGHIWQDFIKSADFDQKHHFTFNFQLFTMI